MTARAQWHTALELGEDPATPRRIKDVGTPIQIGAPGTEASLQRQLVRSLAAESALEELGATCAIKNAADSSCHVCPLYRDDDSHDAQLCAIGRLQERLCTQLTVIRHGGRR